MELREGAAGVREFLFKEVHGLLQVGVEASTTLKILGAWLVQLQHLVQLVNTEEGQVAAMEEMAAALFIQAVISLMVEKA